VLPDRAMKVRATDSVANFGARGNIGVLPGAGGGKRSPVIYVAHPSSSQEARLQCDW
jgi:hypothetical protein